ncbi:MAG: hypothetical protein BMS9Abin36_1814 [Gammaproteobacteria bacterium]|nr:MAG: hypothetical protein BMS9Abin36_1814 [Gammaproteobacteria bacterium]
MAKNKKSPNEFHEAMAGARPLKQDRITPHSTPRKPIPEQKYRDEREVMDALLSDDYAPDEIESGDELLFKRPGIQNHVMRKLRRGQYVIEAELDLHRRTVDEARELLATFLYQAQQQGRRCIRVIHGKGYGSAGKLPVLKGRVNSWLQQKDEVLAFCSAIQRDGGTGAVYVLLKKK